MYHRIFLDLDGVVFDCMGEAKRLAGSSEPLASKEFWVQANRPGFFRNLPLLPDAKQLVSSLARISYLEGLRLQICTATGHNFVDVAHQKRDALKEHFGDMFNCQNTLFLPEGVMKAAYATPRGILIDDTQKVIDAWVSHGGIGILHTDAETTLYQLTKILDK